MLLLPEHEEPACSDADEEVSTEQEGDVLMERPVLRLTKVTFPSSKRECLAMIHLVGMNLGSLASALGLGMARRQSRQAARKST